MIRYRKPDQDDPMILQLIESQLVPLSHMTKRAGPHPQGYSSRLRRGVTLVASPQDNEKSLLLSIS